MARRPVTAKNPIGAVPLALSAAAAYVVLAGTAGYLTLDRRPAPPAPTTAAAAADLPVITTTTAPASTAPAAGTTAPTTPDLPPDLRRVDAPGGLGTVIPVGWEVATGTVATTLVVTDPTSPRRELRLGGAPVTDPSTPLLERITRAAADRERDPATAASRSPRRRSATTRPSAGSSTRTARRARSGSPPRSGSPAASSTSSTPPARPRSGS
ncbi:hypothetical protein ACQPYE_35150 [Actinosynnema sp. CA-299493]